MRGVLRRKKKAMDMNEVQILLENSEVGRLGTCSDNIPYITPVNYIYFEGCIYFHCAVEGHKIDNIKANKNVCFEVDELISIIQSEEPCSMSTDYRSVVVFGEASIINDEDLKVDILKKIVEKYAHDKNISSKLDRKSAASVCIVKIKPDIITGKKHFERENSME